MERIMLEIQCRSGPHAAPTLVVPATPAHLKAVKARQLTAAIRSYANECGPPFICPITLHPREGDLSHLCEEYGCALKGGLSPHSEENHQ